MSLREKILQDLNIAMKSRDELAVLTLRQLSAAFLNKEKDKRYSTKDEKAQLTEEDVLDAVASEAKKRRESIESFEKGGRVDLSAKEKKELEILKKYLPEQLSEEEIKKLVQQAIDKVGAKEIRDMGKVMAELAPQIKGKADGGQVSKIVKDLLSA